MIGSRESLLTVFFVVKPELCAHPRIELLVSFLHGLDTGLLPLADRLLCVTYHPFPARLLGRGPLLHRSSLVLERAARTRARCAVVIKITFRRLENCVRLVDRAIQAHTKRSVFLFRVVFLRLCDGPDRRHVRPRTQSYTLVSRQRVLHRRDESPGRVIPTDIVPRAEVAREGLRARAPTRQGDD